MILANATFDRETSERSKAIESIVPDLGIKIDELPQEIVEQLSTTLGMDEQPQYENIDPEDLFRQAEDLLSLDDNNTIDEKIPLHNDQFPTDDRGDAQEVFRGDENSGFDDAECFDDRPFEDFQDDRQVDRDLNFQENSQDGREFNENFQSSPSPFQGESGPRLRLKVPQSFNFRKRTPDDLPRHLNLKFIQRIPPPGFSERSDVCEMDDDSQNQPDFSPNPNTIPDQGRMPSPQFSHPSDMCQIDTTKRPPLLDIKRSPPLYPVPPPNFQSNVLPGHNRQFDQSVLSTQPPRIDTSPNQQRTSHLNLSQPLNTCQFDAGPNQQTFPILHQPPAPTVQHQQFPTLVPNQNFALLMPNFDQFSSYQPPQPLSFQAAPATSILPFNSFHPHQAIPQPTSTSLTPPARNAAVISPIVNQHIPPLPPSQPPLLPATRLAPLEARIPPTPQNKSLDAEVVKEPVPRSSSIDKPVLDTGQLDSADTKIVGNVPLELPDIPLPKNLPLNKTEKLVVFSITSKPNLKLSTKFDDETYEHLKNKSGKPRSERNEDETENSAVKKELQDQESRKAPHIPNRNESKHEKPTVKQTKDSLEDQESRKKTHTPNKSETDKSDKIKLIPESKNEKLAVKANLEDLEGRNKTHTPNKSEPDKSDKIDESKNEKLTVKQTKANLEELENRNKTHTLNRSEPKKPDSLKPTDESKNEKPSVKQTKASLGDQESRKETHAPNKSSPDKSDKTKPTCEPKSEHLSVKQAKAGLEDQDSRKLSATQNKSTHGLTKSSVTDESETVKLSVKKSKTGAEDQKNRSTTPSYDSRITSIWNESEMQNKSKTVSQNQGSRNKTRTDDSSKLSLKPVAQISKSQETKDVQPKVKTKAELKQMHFGIRPKPSTPNKGDASPVLELTIADSEKDDIVADYTDQKNKRDFQTSKENKRNSENSTNLKRRSLPTDPQVVLKFEPQGSLKSTQTENKKLNRSQQVKKVETPGIEENPKLKSNVVKKAERPVRDENQRVKKGIENIIKSQRGIREDTPDSQKLHYKKKSVISERAQNIITSYLKEAPVVQRRPSPEVIKKRRFSARSDSDAYDDSWEKSTYNNQTDSAHKQSKASHRKHLQR